LLANRNAIAAMQWGWKRSSAIREPTKEAAMKSPSSTWYPVLALTLLGCSGGTAVDLAAQSEPLQSNRHALHKVKHVIIVMQENHSFDNYFGALAYAPGSPYHSPQNRDDEGDGDADDRISGCDPDDHRCVDGLSCHPDAAGKLRCTNANLDDDGSTVVAFHDSRRCVIPDLDHGWPGTHHELNFARPNETLRRSPSDGFVRVNDVSDQVDNGVETPTEDQTMAFYNEDEIPFYYGLAQRFATSDRYFSSVLGPTFPNRAYLLAATSFGHLTTTEEFPPPGGYRPITGTIFDLLESHGVSWANYFQDAPQGGSFRPFSLAGPNDPHFLPLTVFLAQVAGTPGAGALPEVSFVDPNFGLISQSVENDEHPPTDIQRGQAFVSTVVNALRNGPYWPDSVLFITYDEHGGFYDHVRPPRARQGGDTTPDGISPGQCADLSHPPASRQPGGGAFCSSNPFGSPDTSVAAATELCPELGQDPTGPYPRHCATFNQLGARVPFLAISAFAKPHYVSHTNADHTSLLAFIESVFTERDGRRAHLTARDEHAHTLEDLFDFANAPSLSAPTGQATPPIHDCTPIQ
jgi:phospholipase C